MRTALGVVLVGLVLAAPAQAAPIRVTTFADETGNPAACSLREAIEAANQDSAVDGCTAGSGADAVVLGAGTYLLSKAGAGDNDNLTGDLDAVNAGGAITIQGLGAARTTISARGLGDRVLDVLPGKTVTITGVTITGGAPPAENGGGIRSAGTLTLADSAVTGNRAADGSAGMPGGPGHPGGGISSDGALTLVRTTVSSNSAGAGGRGADMPGVGAWDGGAGGEGGGVSSGGVLTIDRSRIVGNHAGAGGRGGDGGIGGAGGDGGDGGGLATGALAMTGTLVAGNSAGAGGAGGTADSGQGGDGGDGGDGGGLRADATATVTFSTFLADSAGALGPGGESVTPPSVPGIAGAGTAVAGIATLARTVAGGTCAGTIADGGLDLGGAGCPGSRAAPLLSPAGVPLLGSPAVDAAPAAGCPAADVLGLVRPQGLRCDIGALEAPALPPAFSPTALGFRDTRVRTTRRRTMTVRNPAAPGTTLPPVSVTGGGFSLAANTCGATLLGGRSCAVTVAFRPGRAGQFTGAVHFGGLAFPLIGTGVHKCVVPKLRGKTVKKARKALRRAHCRLGKVTRRGHGRPGRVRSSKPKAGAVRRAGTKVRVVVNRRG